MTTPTKLYVPALLQNSTPEELSRYLWEEFNRISTALEIVRGNIQLDMYTAEPSHVQDGMVVYADGTNWSPLISSGGINGVGGPVILTLDTDGSNNVYVGGVFTTLGDGRKFSNENRNEQ